MSTKNLLNRLKATGRQSAAQAKSAVNLHFPNVAKYGMNVGKSFLDIYGKIFAESLDNTVSLFETNSTFGEEVLNAIKDPMGSLQSTLSKSNDGKDVDFKKHGKNFISYLLEDIKTGKFYNKERRLGDTGFGDFNLDDNSFGGFDFDDWGDDEFSDSDDPLSKDAKESIRASADIAEYQEAQAEGRSRATIAAIGAVGGEIIKHQSDSHNKTIEMNAAMHSSMMRGLSDIANSSQALLAASTANSTAISAVIEASSNKIYGKLESIEKLLAGAIGPKEDERTSSKKNIFSGDSLNLKNYLNKSFENFKDVTGAGMLGVITSMDTLDNLITMAIQNPLGFVVESIAKNMMGSAIKKSMERFDKTVAMASKAIIGNINKLEDSDNEFHNFIAKIFGFKSGVNDIDLGNYRGNGRDDRYKPRTLSEKMLSGINKATTEVIPTYLRDIARAITGINKTFDYSKGIFVGEDEKKNLGKKINSIRDYTNYTSRTKRYYEDQIKDLSKDEKASAMETFSTIVNIMASRQETFNPYSAKPPKGVDEKDWNSFRSKFIKMKKEEFSDFIKEILGARESRNRNAEFYEEDLFKTGLSAFFNEYDEDGYSIRHKYTTVNKAKTVFEKLSGYNDKLYDVTTQIRDILAYQFGYSKGDFGKISSEVSKSTPLINLPMPPESNKEESTSSENKDKKDEKSREAKFIEDNINKVKGKNIFQKIGNFGKDVVQAPFNLLAKGFDWMDKKLFKLLFGVEPEYDEEGNIIEKETQTSFIEKITDIISSSWKKTTNWLHEKLFGPEGLFTKMKNWFKETIWDKFKADVYDKGKTYLFDKDTGKLTPLINKTKSFFGDVKESIGFDRSKGILGNLWAQGKEGYSKAKNYSLAEEDDDVMDNKPDGMSPFTFWSLGIFRNIRKSTLEFKKFLFGDIYDKFGDRKEGVSTESSELWDKIRTEFKGFLPKGIGGAALGVGAYAGAGMLTGLFLPGGPIMAALLGSFGAFISHSHKFKNFLFGKQKEDSKGNPMYDGDGFPIYEGGAIDNNGRKLLLNYLPKIGGGIAAGGLFGSMFLGSNLLGKVLGGFLGIAASSKELQKTLFGKGAFKTDENGNDILDSNGNRIPDENAGIFSKRFRKGVLKTLGIGIPTTMALRIMGNSGIMGLSLLPGGPIMSALAGFGIALNSDAISAYFFGKKDKNGNKISDGVFGKIFAGVKGKVFDPIANAINKAGKGMVDWIKNKFTEPFKKNEGLLKGLVEDTKDRIKFMFLDIGRFLKWGVGGILKTTSKLLFGDGFLSKGIRKMFSWIKFFDIRKNTNIFKWALQAIPMGAIGLGKLNESWNFFRGQALNKRRSKERALNMTRRNPSYEMYKVKDKNDPDYGYWKVKNKDNGEDVPLEDYLDDGTLNKDKQANDNTTKITDSTGKIKESVDKNTEEAKKTGEESNNKLEDIKKQMEETADNTKTGTTILSDIYGLLVNLVNNGIKGNGENKGPSKGTDNSDQTSSSSSRSKLSDDDEDDVYDYFKNQYDKSEYDEYLDQLANSGSHIFDSDNEVISKDPTKKKRRPTKKQRKAAKRAKFLKDNENFNVDEDIDDRFKKIGVDPTQLGTQVEVATQLLKNKDTNEDTVNQFMAESLAIIADSTKNIDGGLNGSTGKDGKKSPGLFEWIKDAFGLGDNGIIGNLAKYGLMGSLLKLFSWPFVAGLKGVGSIGAQLLKHVVRAPLLQTWFGFDHINKGNFSVGAHALSHSVVKPFIKTGIKGNYVNTMDGISDALMAPRVIIDPGTGMPRYAPPTDDFMRAAANIDDTLFDINRGVTSPSYSKYLDMMDQTNAVNRYVKGGRTADALTDVAKVATKGAVKTGSKLGNVVSKFDEIDNAINGKIIGALNKTIDGIAGFLSFFKMEWLAKWLTKLKTWAANLVKKVATKAMSTKLGQVVAKITPGLNFALLAYNIAESLKETSMILHIAPEDVTWTMRGATLIASLICYWLFFLDVKDVASGIYEFFGGSDLKAKQSGLQAEFDEYRKNGGSLEFNDWVSNVRNRHDKTILRKVWDWGYFGITGKGAKYDKEIAITEKLNTYKTVGYGSGKFKDGEVGVAGNISGALGAGLKGIGAVLSGGLYLVQGIFNGVMSLVSYLTKTNVEDYTTNVNKQANDAVMTMQFDDGTNGATSVTEEVPSLRNMDKSGSGYANSYRINKVAQNTLKKYGGAIDRTIIKAEVLGTKWTKEELERNGYYKRKKILEDYKAGKTKNLIFENTDKRGMRTRLEKIREYLEKQKLLEEDRLFKNNQVIKGGIKLDYYQGYDQAYAKLGISAEKYERFCGFICVANVIKHYASNTNYTPADIYLALEKYQKKFAKYLDPKLPLIRHGMLSVSAFGYSGVWDPYNVKFDVIPLDEAQRLPIEHKIIDAVIENIRNSQPVILLGKSTGDDKNNPFTSAPHYVMIGNVIYSGNPNTTKYYIVDPFGLKTEWYRHSDLFSSASVEIYAIIQSSYADVKTEENVEDEKNKKDWGKVGVINAFDSMANILNKAFTLKPYEEKKVEKDFNEMSDEERQEAINREATRFDYLADESKAIDGRIFDASVYDKEGYKRKLINDELSKLTTKISTSAFYDPYGLNAYEGLDTIGVDSSFILDTSKKYNDFLKSSDFNRMMEKGLLSEMDVKDMLRKRDSLKAFEDSGGNINRLKMDSVFFKNMLLPEEKKKEIEEVLGKIGGKIDDLGRGVKKVKRNKAAILEEDEKEKEEADKQRKDDAKVDKKNNFMKNYLNYQETVNKGKSKSTKSVIDKEIKKIKDDNGDGTLTVTHPLFFEIAKTLNEQLEYSKIMIQTLAALAQSGNSRINPSLSPFESKQITNRLVQDYVVEMGKR